LPFFGPWRLCERLLTFSQLQYGMGAPPLGFTPSAFSIADI